ncbi:general substrate transporter [Aspergillus floccosus]
MACISLIGVTLQTSATTAAQFTLGRIINFAMTGFCIVVTPIYQSECSPAALRGMISSTIQFQILLGQVISSLVNLGTSHMVTDAAWRIPVYNSLCRLLCWDSCRLCRSLQDEQAQHCLSSLRNKGSNDPTISEEIQNLQHDHSNESKGQWKELFNNANRTRTWIAVLVMFFQQITGQAFVSQYSVSFYKTQKIADPFLLNVIQNLVSMICNMITFTYVDSLGRRYENLLITLHPMLTTISHPSESQKNAMAASMMVAFGFYGLSWAPISYIVLGEVSNSRVKEKTSNLAVSISVITTFIVSFTVPYLINAPYANLGGKVGFLYGGITFVSVAVAYFYVPELKGLSLEEVDRLFATGHPVRRLSARALAMANDDGTGMNKP